MARRGDTDGLGILAISRPGRSRELDELATRAGYMLGRFGSCCELATWVASRVELVMTGSIFGPLGPLPLFEIK